MPNQRGFTLVELMTGMLIAMIISLGVMKLYVEMSKNIFQSARKEQAAQDALAGFDQIADLLMQAEMCLFSCGATKTITITYPTAGAGLSNPNPAGSLAQTGDSLTLDFTVPSGFYNWPNTTAPYTNNAIRVKWSYATGIVTVSAGASTADADSARTPIPVAGGDGKLNYKVVNLDLWPMTTASGVISQAGAATDKPTGGYLLRMTVRGSQPDTSYLNNKDTNGLMANYRTITYSRVIIPRNW